jgi:calcineurin-like phosphoesterase
MFETADTPCFMQGCVFTIDRDTGKTVNIEAVTVR